MSKKEVQDPKQLAQSIGLEDVDTEQAIDEIFHDILLSVHRANPRAQWEKELNSKIEKVYKEKYGVEWSNDTDKILSTLLLGSPGQGKTTAFKEASKAVASALELKFALNPPETMFSKRALLKESLQKVLGLDVLGEDDHVKFAPVINKDLGELTAALKELSNHKDIPADLKKEIKDNLKVDMIKKLRETFVFVSQECSGENSKTEFGGLPAKVTEDGVEYMTKVVNDRLARCSQAGAACLLLDDFPNASPNIQNIGLSLTDEKRFQQLVFTNTYIGLTGNLGSLDGTHTTRLSTALRGRCKIYFTQDKLPKFINRSQQRFRDELGDCGVTGFLNRLPQYFTDMPNTKMSGGFASPRTWDHVTLEVRRAVRRSGSGAAAMKDVKRITNALVGLEAGQAFYGYYFSLMQNADPLARECIQVGKLNETELKKRFADGFSSNEQHFAYQFAIALSDYAVRRIANDKTKLEETVNRLATGTLALDQSVIPFAIDNFKMQLANQVDEFSTKGVGNDRKLVLDVKKKIVEIFNKNPNCTQDHIDLLVDAITDADKFDMSTRRRGRRM